MNVISNVIKNRHQVPKREFKITAILLIGLGIFHTFIFYKTAGRVFPDDLIPRLLLMIFLLSMLLLTIIYVRCRKYVKKYSLV